MTMRKPDGTDGSLLQSLPWTLAALGFSVVPHVPYVPLWITAALLGCGAWRMHIERRRGHLPPAWVRVLLALICFLGVLATYENVSGIGPGSALLAIMAALKLLETRKRRDQFVLLFIAIFMQMSSLLREQYLWSLPFLAVGISLTMTAWLRMAAGPNISFRQSFATSSRLLLLATPIMLAMWIFFPRLASPFWAVPVDTSKAQTGLSDTMSPGDISSLSLSDEVAFRVDFVDRVPNREHLYWRALVLTSFNGRTWTSNDTPSRSSLGHDIEFIADPVEYQVTVEPTSQHWVYALDLPSDWSLDNTLRGRNQQLIRTRPIDQRVSYSATSYTRFAIQREKPAHRFYLWLTPETNKRSQELAVQMRTAAGSDDAFISDVLRMFNEQEYFYTLEPPPLGSNPVDRFLFDTMRGFCEHYASAFAVLARAAGIPSRIVLGYQGGEFNLLGGHLTVRQSDAHAWNEVWLDGRGWVRIDPTAAVAPERISVGISGAMFDGIGASWGLGTPSRLLHQLTQAWDALDATWNEWVLGYGPDNQSSLMEWFGMDEPDWRKMLLTLLAIVALSIGLISVMLAFRNRPPRKDEAARLYRKFTSRLGEPPKRGEAPVDYARRIASSNQSAAIAVERVTRLYLNARYGPRDKQTILALKDELRRFKAA